MSAPHAPALHDKPPSRHDAWLAAFVEDARPWYSQNGLLLPHVVHIGAGWGYVPRHAEGPHIQSHLVSGTSTEDAAPQIFISPVLAGAVEIAANVHHQLVHTIYDPDTRHGAEFREACRRIGLEGTQGRGARPELGEELLAQLTRFIRRHGTYPHPPMGVLVAPIAGTVPAQQTTRWLTVFCPVCPGHRAKHRTFQVSRATAADGAPICGRVLNPEDPEELHRRCQHVTQVGHGDR